MSNLEVLTDATLHAKYGVTPPQYAGFATMRGDASDGLPGVPGVGEKTAVSLLSTFGSLDGIIAAAADHESGMAAPVRARIRAAADYLAIAPTVVNVVRNLELPPFDGRIRAISERQASDLHRLSNEWALGTSLERVRAALKHPE
jgi:5'-3' exonuclease